MTQSNCLLVLLDNSARCAVTQPSIVIKRRKKKAEMSRDSKADGHGQSSRGKLAPASQWGSGTTPRRLQIEVTRAP